MVIISAEKSINKIYLEINVSNENTKLLNNVMSKEHI